MKIAIIGSRGIPARYGGFETFAEYLGSGLAKLGHKVTVYCRNSNAQQNPPPKSYKGVRLVHLPCLKTKSLETLSHEFLSILHSLKEDYDLYYLLGYRSSLVYLSLKLLRKTIVLHTDGLEWKRGKWGRLARAYLRLSEWLATKITKHLVVDSQALGEYYRDRYGVSCTYISYGAEIIESQDPSVLQKYDLRPFEYLLVICRLEPENNLDLIIKAFEGIEGKKKLVIVGGVNYDSQYAKRLMSTKDPRVVFPGAIYERPDIQELRYNCYAYIHAHEVGGTNPTLLEAMAAGNWVLALDTPFNAEVLGQAGLSFKKDVRDLKEKLLYVLKHPELRQVYGAKAIERVKEYYTWERVIKAHENLFISILEKS